MAGASMKDIKLRIKSVESTMQITKAMQLVATSKLRRARERMEESKPYASIAQQAMAAVIEDCLDTTIPYVSAREQIKTRLYIIVAGDRGLAGGYNANVFRAVEAHIKEHPVSSYSVLPIGKKAVDKYAHAESFTCIDDSFIRVEGISVGTCYGLAKTLIEGYDDESFDEVVLFYTDFVSAMNQEVRTMQLLPLVREQNVEVKNAVSTVYEPEPTALLGAILPDYLAGMLYSTICDSFASEVAARRSAMDSATKNAGEMIADLRLEYNRARQGAITQEITEIVAGANV
ncbi:MAG: ATP synthase F1 subunit gamma [Clostridia bacterium]|nr:ATP synthase F1 subunit gamma [Clostridia bacterium]